MMRAAAVCLVLACAPAWAGQQTASIAVTATVLPPPYVVTTARETARPHESGPVVRVIREGGRAIMEVVF